MSAPAPSLVIITGANGLIGSATVLQALQAGHHVRAVVRRQEAIDVFRAHEQVRPYVAAGALAFVHMPDMLAAGAFEAAAQGCTSIIHVAAPMKILTDDMGDLAVFSRHATRVIFAAAERIDSVRRIVFTGSILGIHEWEEILPDAPVNQQRLHGHLTAGTMLTADRVVPELAPAGLGCHAKQRYLVGKVVTHQEVAKYVAAHPDARFDVVNILPGYVFGASLLARTKTEQFSSSNAYLVFVVGSFRIGPLYGLPEDQDHPMMGYMCHVSDVAEAHVKALDRGLVTRKLSNYIVASDGPHGARYNDAIAAFQKYLPDVASGLPFHERRETLPGYFDSSPVERELLGRPLKTFDEQVRDTFLHWHQLPDELET